MNIDSVEEKMFLYNQQVLDEIFGMERASEEKKIEWSHEMFQEPHEIE